MSIKITTFAVTGEAADWTVDTFVYLDETDAIRSLASCLQALRNLGYTILQEREEGLTRTFTAQHDTEPCRQIVIGWTN